MTKEQLIDIFWEVVGDPQDNEFDFEQYTSMVNEDSTEAEARSIAKLIKEIADESPYEA